MQPTRPCWTPESWRSLTARQQPEWNDTQKLEEVRASLASLPPLVFAGEIRNLRQQLAKVRQGKAFLLQGGDCSESFDGCTALNIRENLKVILQMAVILTFSGHKSVVKLGRIAGQYAKPRSKPTETIDGVEYPSYRGDMVNRIALDHQQRQPNPANMQEGYFRAAATLNLLRSFTQGGFADLRNVHKWNLEFVRNVKEGGSYEALAQEISKAIDFFEVIGVDKHQALHEVDYYTSHEALLLDYEQALTRADSLTGQIYGCSAHMLWIGDRTRALDEAHVEFCRGIGNPIGIKIGPKHDANELVELIKTINPDNEDGKVILIIRMGHDAIADLLPQLIQQVRDSGQHVIWSCDPMHGNTISLGKYKTRKFDTIVGEMEQFFQICRAKQVYPGGIHAELTGLDVTECLRGNETAGQQALEKRYETTCDPRLNAKQSIELSFKLAELIRPR